MNKKQQAFHEQSQQAFEELTDRTNSRVYTGSQQYEIDKAITETSNEIVILTPHATGKPTNSKKHNKIINKTVTQQIKEYKSLIKQLQTGTIDIVTFDRLLASVDTKYSAIIHKAVLATIA